MAVMVSMNSPMSGRAGGVAARTFDRCRRLVARAWVGGRVAAMRLLLLVLCGLSSPAHAVFLEPDQAFQASARTVDARTIEVTYRIADGYYLYRERFKFALDPATAHGATLGEPVFPKGEIKFDETFQKDVEHYRKEVVVRLPIAGATGPATLLSTSQGCADAGLCYPPQVATLALAVFAGPDAGRAGAPLDDKSRIERTLKGGNYGWIALLFVGLGVLLAFTPCVLPMVPILSSILVAGSGSASTAGTDGAMTRTGGLRLAIAYSLGLALVYTLLGIAAGLAGEGLSAALQTPWILGSFAALLVLLSLSMFGFYELQVPPGLQARIAQWSGRVGASKGGTGGVGRFAGVFAMGALSALIVGPCVAAPLAGALLYISQTRDVVVGGVALFSLAIGMSVPLLLIGLSAGSLLPRVGAWMETVKHFFGVLLLAVALWMVTPVLPSWVVMLAWAAMAVIAAVFLRVFDALAPDARGAARFAKGVGVLLLLAGAVEFVGVATGGRDLLQPLARLAQRGDGEPGASTAAVDATSPPFESVKGTADLDRRIAAAGKPVMLDFYADWCVSCKEMERFTYTDARVASRMQDFVRLKADVTANDADDKALLKRFNLYGPPGIVFFAADGREIADAGVIGFQNADRFLSSLESAQSRAGS